MRILDAKYSFVITVLLSFLVYLYFGYFFERTQFIALIGFYSVLFSCFIFWQKFHTKDSESLFKIGITFRILLLFSTPFLSQDFYRFIWDGRLIFIGINPYQFFPIDLLDANVAVNQSQFLVEKMGELSANHYSNYPPLNQFLFFIAALFSAKSIFGSILILKIIIILADIGIYIYGKKLLLLLNQNSNNINWYFLNPLVILELTGNLHFEGVMLFFMLLGFYFFYKKNLILAALFIAIAISIKLLPLLLLPLFYQKLKFKKSFIFYGSIILLNILFFLPFLSSELILNYTETVGLWFSNFEFNASIYYVIREIGFWITGYNIIEVVGKLIPILSILMILYFAFFKQNFTLAQLAKNALIVLTFYFLISTTVHPWYIINLIFLSIFTKLKFPIIWSFSIVLSYFAYSVIPFKENIYLLFMEYLLVFGFIYYEFRKSKIIADEI